MNDVDKYLKYVVPVSVAIGAYMVWKFVNDSTLAASKVVNASKNLAYAEKQNDSIANKNLAEVENILLAGSINGVPLTMEQRKELEGIRESALKELETNNAGVFGWFGSLF